MLSEPGRPLDRADHNYFREKLGWDFADVRIHEGPSATRGAQSVHAHAYTVGNHIVLGANSHTPDRRLLSHELVHVLQQRALGAPNRDKPIIVASDSDPLEREADVHIDSAVRGSGLTAGPGSAPGVRLQRDAAGGDQDVRGLEDVGWLVFEPSAAPPADLARGGLNLIRGQFPQLDIKVIFVVSDALYAFVPGDAQPRKRWDLTESGAIPRPGVFVGAIDRGQDRLYVRGKPGKQEFYLVETTFRKSESVEITSWSKATGAELKGLLGSGLALWIRAGTAAARTRAADKSPGSQQSPSSSEAGGEQKQRAKPPPPFGGKSGSEFEGGKGPPATDPGWPAQLQGPDLQPTGGTGTYSMVLDWSMLGTQADLLSMVTNQMAPIVYNWESFNITAIAKKGLTAKAAAGKRTEAISDEDTVGPGAVMLRDAERRANDLGEDASTAFKSMVQQRPDESAAEAVWRMGVNYENLTLMPFSVITSLGGALIDTFSTMVSAYSSEQRIPWPKTPGVFMVRCIALPQPQGDRRRAPSFAVKVVEVRPTEWLARNTLGAAEAEIEELKAAIQLEQDPERKRRLQDRLHDAEIGAHGTAVEALELAVTRKKAERDAATSNKEKLQSEFDALTKQLARARGRAAPITGNAYRPRAAFASEVTGQTYPLILQLGRLPDEGERHVWLLSDDTSKEGDTFLGKARKDEDAIWNAFYEYSRKNGFGRGRLAVQLPDAIPDLTKRADVLRNADADTALLKKRLDDLVTILVALSLFVPGVGEVAAILGGALAAERLWERYRKGNLELTDPATIGDIIAVLGAVATGLGSIGKLRLAKAQRGFALLGEDATEAAVAGAASDLEDAQAFLRGSAKFGKIVAYGGLIWGNVSALDQLVKINQLEMEGTITHSEARIQRADAILGAVQTNVLFIHGALEAQRQAVAADDVPPEQAGRRPPPAKGTTGADDAATTAKVATETSPAGAVRGAKVYKVSGSELIKSGEPSLENGLDLAAAGVTRPGVTVARTSTPVTGQTSTFELTVKPASGPDIVVKVTVEATKAMGGPGLHGVESGPARVVLKPGAAGWEAVIKIRDGVSPRDVASIAGHEFNEIAKILQDFPNASPATVQAQMEAAVFKPGGAGTPTAHDYAAAKELSASYAELRAAKAASDKVSYDAARARVERMKEAMGLIKDPSAAADPATLKARLDALRAIDLPLDAELELRPEVEALASNQRRAGGTELIPERVKHILFPESTSMSDFQKAGLGGAHLEGELMRLQDSHREYHFEEVAAKPMGTATAKKFLQYRYKNGVPPAGAGWGEPNFNAADWTAGGVRTTAAGVSMPPVYKTTVSDATVLLDQGAAAWDNFPGSKAKPTTKTLVEWKATSPAGYEFSGYAQFDPATGKWTIESLYPEATWF